MYTGNPPPFALAVFFLFIFFYLSPDDCAKSLPLATLNPEFTENEWVSEMFSFAAFFFINSRNLLSPLTLYSSVDVHLFSLKWCLVWLSFFVFSFNFGFSTPLVLKLLLIESICSQAHFPLFSLLPCLSKDSAAHSCKCTASLLTTNLCVSLSLRPRWLPRSYLPAL